MFKSGITLEPHKISSEYKEISDIGDPPYIYLKNNMHKGTPANVVVSIGDQVKIGTLVASKSGIYSAALHSPISGKVIDIKTEIDSTNEIKTIIIENDFKNTIEPTEIPFNFKREIINSGIVGLSGSGFPTDIKLCNINQNVTHLIVNVVECEPYLTADRASILDSPFEFIEGIDNLLVDFNIKKATIFLEENSKNVQAKLIRHLKEYKNINLKVIENRYPSGSEKVILSKYFDTNLKRDELPMDYGFLVLNASTIIAIHNFCYNEKSLTERVVTISGNEVKNKINIRVKIGTPIKYILDKLDISITEKTIIVDGGPMMGKQTFIDSSVSKTTTMLWISKPSKAIQEVQSNCIRCSACIEVCPAGLYPIKIYGAIKTNNIDLAKKLGAQKCLECASCTFQCPSRINLHEEIKRAKNQISMGENL